jgi:hypothetical protein
MSVQSKREEAARRRLKADRAAFVAGGGEALWRQELVRRRAERTGRARVRAAEALAARRAGDGMLPFGDGEVPT